MKIGVKMGVEKPGTRPMRRMYITATYSDEEYDTIIEIARENHMAKGQVVRKASLAGLKFVKED